MKFAEPLWLLIGLLACIALVVIFRLATRARQRKLETFAASHLLPQLTASVSGPLRLIKQILWVAATACLFIALARPQWGFYWEEIKRKGIDILIAIDTSKSMLTEDVKPNRLDRAKLAVTDLLDEIGGDRIGLIAFAGESFLQCPLTLDHTAFSESLDALDTNTIPLGGTNVASAIQEAEATFTDEENSYKVLVLITDGEDLEGNALTAAREAASKGVKIFTVGVGTTAGELIPLPDGKGVVTDEKGNPVKSHLDENMLRQIASETGAAYEPLGSRGEGLIKIYNEHLKVLPQHELSSRQQRVYYERFQWPLGLALLLFIIELALIDRRTPTQHKLESSDIRPKHLIAPRRNRPSRHAATTASLVVAALLLAGQFQVRASTGAAEDAYKKGDYKTALDQYTRAASKNPNQQDLQYNLGAAAYKESEWKQAAESFQQSLGAKNPALVENASYNLGNTLYRTGQQTEKSNPQQTIGNWEQAIQAYEGALRIKADDADAKYNLEYVKKKLEELKKQQQQQQQKDQDKNQDKNQNQDQNQQQQQNQQQSSDQNQQNKNQQNQQNQNKQNQSGQNKDQQNQNGQNGQKPDDQKSQQPKPDQKNGPQSQQAQNQDEGTEEQHPGKMTRGEARNLLDSAKGEERKVYLFQAKQNDKVEQTDAKKDW